MAPDEADIPDEDLRLHQEISGRDRVDAILASTRFTTEQAVEALDAQFRENQASFRHIAIIHVAVTGADGRPGIHTAYVGPFADRREAEKWVRAEIPEDQRITYELGRIDTAHEFEESRERLRRIMDADPNTE